MNSTEVVQLDRYPEYGANFKGEIFKWKSGREIQGYILPNGFRGTKVGNRVLFFQYLIAEQFIPNPNEKLIVEHIDGDVLNNSVENLRWVGDCVIPLNDYPKYGITKKGKVFNLITKRELKGVISSTGYRIIKIEGDKRLIHELVAEQFLPNPNQGIGLKHSDGNILNNSVTNLKWIYEGIIELRDFPGYGVNRRGEFFNLRLKRRIKGCLFAQKYLAIMIEGRTFTIHRIVAEYFVPNPNQFFFVVHKDGDCFNNQAENLIWSPVQGREYCARAIYATDFDGNVVERYEHEYEARAAGYTVDTIRRCLKGTLSSHAGLKWFYVDEKKKYKTGS